MVKANFRFATAMALVMAVAAVVLAIRYDLPLRDPDGVAVPTYVRLPFILLAAFLTDVLPRAVWSSRRHLLHLPQALVAVVRERWTWSHTQFALVGLGAWYVSYAAFRNIKSFVPFVNKHVYDNALASFDRMLWLGHDPAQVLHSLFGTTWAAHFFSGVYLIWIGLIPFTLAVALVFTRKAAAGAWFVTAIAVDWVLGVATYLMVPTLGPIYSDPTTFAALPQTYVSTIQADMLEDRMAVLADPFATHAVQTIAAFASLHVAMMVTICLMVELLRLKPWIRMVSWIYLVLTVLSTVYLGWHFFADALGGAALGAAGVWIAALGTGNHHRGRPALVARLDVDARAEEPAPSQS